MDTKLAIHGGKPVRGTQIHYGRQYIDEADCDAVRTCMLGDLITTGPRVQALEERLCAMTGAKYAVALANGTAALHAAAHAAGFGPGDEVIVTPMTFAASANCILYQGATPVFADIDPATYNIDPAQVEAHITPRTKGIVAVDFTGQACDLDPLLALRDKHGLTLIEDAAHALGTRYNGKAVGGIADLTTFSFHPVKTVTGGEGGAILTNDKALYDRMMLFRTHGITREEDQMGQPTQGLWFYDQVDLGYNYRLTDIQSALLLSQLDKFPLFAARRKEIVARYDAAFADFPEIIVQREIPQSDTVRHLYVVQLRPELLKGTRREIFDALYAENVCCNVHYIPTYQLSYYRNLGYEKGLCPNAETFYENALSIPLYYGLTDGDVESVLTAFRKVLDYYRK